VTGPALPPGWTWDDPEPTAPPGSACAAPPDKSPFDYAHGPTAEDAAGGAWWQYLLEQPMPDPAPAAALRELCRGLAEHLRADQPLIGRGRRAAGGLIHVPERTLVRWCRDGAIIPWPAAELLRRMVHELRENSGE